MQNGPHTLASLIALGTILSAGSQTAGRLPVSREGARRIDLGFTLVARETG